MPSVETVRGPVDVGDLDHLREIADRGATIGADRFGVDVFNPTDQRVATIAALCADFTAG
jgi:phosphotriesterase-related protein